jgi:2-alkyl-3-oxoalkanoate reductase
MAARQSEAVDMQDSAQVFVTGGTGVLGRAVIPRLIAKGYRVRALAHTEEAVDRLTALGAEPVRGSLFDPDSIRQTAAGAGAILHLATRIPRPSRMGRRAAWSENDRIRTLGTRMLVDAALSIGVKVFVYPSIAFVYPDRGSDWIDADSTPPRKTDDITLSSLRAEAEVDRFTAGGGRGIVLRLGPLYGPETPSTNTQVKLARRGFITVFGPDEAYSPSLWTDDAANALVAALDSNVPAGVYDVADDEPLTRRELGDALRDAAGQRWAMRPPMAVVRMQLPAMAPYAGLSTRISNRRFKEVSGWRPRVADARDGWRRIAASVQTRTNRERSSAAVRPLLMLLLLVVLPVGLWAMALPLSFYAQFPGFSHTWVSGDGPYNEHLVRDVGSLYLALGVLLVCALITPTRELVRAVSLATLVSSVLHFSYHAVHLDLLPSAADAAVQTVALAIPIVAATWLFRAASLRHSADRRPGAVIDAPAVTTHG